MLFFFSSNKLFCENIINKLNDKDLEISYLQILTSSKSSQRTSKIRAEISPTRKAEVLKVLKDLNSYFQNII